MSVETGLEILDAIINNPIQAILLFAFLYIGFKFLFGCHGFWADMRHDLTWSSKRRLERTLDNSIEWLEKKCKDYENWSKTKTEKDWLKYSVIGWSCVFPPLLLWNILFPSESEIANIFLNIVLTIEYIGIMAFSIYIYQKRRKKELKNEGC